MHSQKIIYRASERGFANHGWLKSYHSFSFADYYDPGKMGFGLLRVLNNDYVAPSKGFNTHAHNNMEIISIPLSGELKHEDSMGNTAIIKTNEVQIMSAGTGITHSEFNNLDSQEVEFLQIWVYPKERDITPRYEQKNFNPAERHNKLQPIVSPNKEEGSIWINQNAYFSLASFDQNKEFEYKTHNTSHGVYIFVVSGKVKVLDEELAYRDAMGISETESITIQNIEKSELLLIEVPMMRS